MRLVHLAFDTAIHTDRTYLGAHRRPGSLHLYRPRRIYKIRLPPT